MSRVRYATKKQWKIKNLLMYCSIGLPRITADKLARVHSQSCTSHGPQVVQRKQKKLNLLFAAQPLFPRPQAPRVWFRRNTSSTRVSAGAPQARRNFWHPRTMSFTRTRRGKGLKKTESWIMKDLIWPHRWRRGGGGGDTGVVRKISSKYNRKIVRRILLLSCLSSVRLPKMEV